MQRSVNFILLLFVIFIDSSLSAKKHGKSPITSNEDALFWLNKYGYNPCLNSDVQCSLSFESIIQEYQKRFRLKVTGKLDDKTKQHMNRPRCGNTDKSIAELNAAQLERNKWSRSSLTYSLRGYPTQLNQAKTENIIREAFQAWTKHVPLTIEPVCSTCSADLVIEFLRERHSDAYAFDGVGGTLAHAFFPEDGRVHFDKDEAWTESFNNYDTNLYLVAVHEIGHALGLDHSYDQASIMYPSYQVMAKENILPQTDRLAIESLYGKKQSTSATRTTTRLTTMTTTTTTTRKIITTTRSSVTVPAGNSHPRCRLTLDAAFKHPDGTLHTFNAGLLWRYLPDRNKWDDRTSTYGQMYTNLPRKLTASVYDSQKNEILFFTDKNVYRYDVDYRNHAKYRSQESLARNLRNSVVGAIYYKDEVYIITQKTMRLFQLDNSYQQSRERSLSDEFPRFSGTVTKAFSYGNLHHFFTLDRLVYVWSERLNSWQTFAKPMETNWFACSNTATSILINYDEKPTQRPNYEPSYGRHRYPHRHHHHHHNYD